MRLHYNRSIEDRTIISQKQERQRASHHDLSLTGVPIQVTSRPADVKPIPKESLVANHQSATHSHFLLET